MERRQAVRIALVIASISTAFLPWISISLFGFTANISLFDILIGAGDIDASIPWIASGAVYILGSGLLTVWDKASYLQLLGLVILPAYFLMESGDLGGMNSLKLLWAVSGYGLLLAHATALVGLLLFARPTRVMTVIERLFGLIRSHRSMGRAVEWIQPTRQGGMGSYPIRYGAAHDRMPAPRPVVRPRPIASEDWWSDDPEGAACVPVPEEVPCIRLPPPRSRSASSAERTYLQGGHHDR